MQPDIQTESFLRTIRKTQLIFRTDPFLLLIKKSQIRIYPFIGTHQLNSTQEMTKERSMSEEKRRTCDAILETMLLGVKDLQEGYPAFIKLEVKDDVY